MYSPPTASPAPQAAYLSYLNQQHGGAAGASAAAAAVAAAATAASGSPYLSHGHASSSGGAAGAIGASGLYSRYGGFSSSGTPSVAWAAPRNLPGHSGHQQHPSLSSLVGSSANGMPSSPANYAAVQSSSAVSGSFPPRNSSSILTSHSPAHSHVPNGNGALSSSVAANSSHRKVQLQGADISRQSGAPHHHARAAATAAKSAANVVDAAKPLLPANGLRQDVLRSSQNTALPSSDEPFSSPAKRATIPGKLPPHETDEDQSWTQLDLGGMCLRAIAPELFRYDFLTSLFINHNDLTILTPEIAKLKHLEVLDASQNHLALLPPELGLLPGLKELYLFDNAITVLPPQLGMLYQLETLGIEGNPLDRDQLSEIQQNGTVALIRALRDTSSAPPPPAKRKWITLTADTGEAEANQDDPDTAHLDRPDERHDTLSVMGYNVLADKLATEQIYGYTPSWALQWRYRKELIVKEIRQLGSDMVCLQEVGMQQYDEFFAPLMHTYGYAGVYYAKSRVKTMRDEEKRRVDGCAVFYKRAKFHLVDKYVIEYGTACLQRNDFRSSEDVYNRVMPRDQVGVICCFEYRGTGAKLIVANTHLHWDPAYSDVKLVQAAMLMDELQQAGRAFCKRKTDVTLPAHATAPSYADGTLVPTVLCGDFNSEPHSGVAEFLSTGRLSGQHTDFLDKTYGDVTAKGLAHSLQLKSSYGAIGELPFTNFTPGYTGVLEYLFYTSDTVEPTALLGPVDPDYAACCVGFPDAHFPSDHIPLAAKYRIRLPASATVVRPDPDSNSDPPPAPGPGSGPSPTPGLGRGSGREREHEGA